MQHSSEASAWYLLGTLAKVAKQYKNCGLYHGDIQPWTVHLTKDQQVVVLDNLLLFPKFRDNLNKATSNCAYKGAFSPLQIQSLVRKEKFFGHNSFASEIWAVGMTVLCFASLKQLNYFYDWTSKQIKYESIDEQIQRLDRLGYSRIFVNLIKNMLVVDEAKRSSIEVVLACTSLLQSQDTLYSNSTAIFKPDFFTSVQCQNPL